MKTTIKNISILTTLLFAFIIIIFASFAFLTDTTYLNTKTKAGFVETTITKQLQITNLENLNPGDNDFTIPLDYRLGSEHNLEFSFKNTGTKSIVTRNIITIRGINSELVDLKNVSIDSTVENVEINLLFSILSEYHKSISETVLGTTYFGIDGETDLISEKELRQTDIFQLYLEEYKDYIVSMEKYQESIESGFNFGKPLKPWLPITSLRFVSDQTALNASEGLESSDTKYLDSFTILGATRNETCTSVDYNYKLKFAKEAQNLMQGQEIDIDLEVQSMQFRNTSDFEWDTLFRDTLKIIPETMNIEPNPNTKTIEFLINDTICKTEIVPFFSNPVFPNEDEISKVVDLNYFNQFFKEWEYQRTSNYNVGRYVAKFDLPKYEVIFLWGPYIVDPIRHRWVFSISYEYVEYGKTPLMVPTPETFTLIENGINKNYLFLRWDTDYRYITSDLNVKAIYIQKN